MICKVFFQKKIERKRVGIPLTYLIKVKSIENFTILKNGRKLFFV